MIFTRRQGCTIAPNIRGETRSIVNEPSVEDDSFEQHNLHLAAVHCRGISSFLYVGRDSAHQLRIWKIGRSFMTPSTASTPRRWKSFIDSLHWALAGEDGLQKCVRKAGITILINTLGRYHQQVDQFPKKKERKRKTCGPERHVDAAASNL